MTDIDDFDVEVGLCKNCYHYVYREIKPFEDSIEQWEEEFNIDITEDSIIETHMCSILNIDLDHTVIKCNKYLDKTKAAFSKNITMFSNDLIKK